MAMTPSPAVPADGNVPPAAAWIRTVHRRPDAVVRLACFPHAGGAANAFTALSAALPRDVELLAVQYPGRQGRRAEPCAEDVSALAEGAATALAGYADRPLFLLGHSMGALVAYETALLLEQRGGVAGLLVSAARPPSQDWAEPDVAAVDDDDLVAGLRRLGGVPEPLLADPESRAEVLRVLRADHRALLRYRHHEGATLRAPLTVLLAKEDPKNSLEQMRDWARHTTGRYHVELHPGGHFALLDRPGEVAGLITAEVRAHRTAPAGPAAGGGPAGSAAGEAPAAARTDLLRDILVGGLRNRRPRLPTDLTRLEDAAREALSPEAWGYVAGNAGSGGTGRANRADHDRWRLVPRMLRGVARRDLSVTLFGQRLSVPVLLAPVAAQAVVHPDGELASVRAAAEVDVPFVLSTFASRTLEEVAEVAGTQPRWFQLYPATERTVTESLVRRAESAGYQAIVVTVDATSLGFRPAELDSAYSPFLRGVGIANFTGDPAFRAGLPAEPDGMAVVGRWAAISTNPYLSGDDLTWLRGLTALPILVKGVLHPEDARAAVDCGADGVVVSNHGGRQLDGSVTALEALPAVRAALGGDVPVLMDSGLRTGTDVLRALALGADAVLYGRPYVYGLALDGQAGVAHVLRCLLADLEVAMALTGCRTVGDITADVLATPGCGPMDPGAHRPTGHSHPRATSGA